MEFCRKDHIGTSMSGRRHHYLPRFLQRPFAHRQNGKESYVYAHHSARGAYPSNVMNLGLERDFYGSPEDTTLDDEITKGSNIWRRPSTSSMMDRKCQPTTSLHLSLHFRSALRPCGKLYPTLLHP